MPDNIDKKGVTGVSDEKGQDKTLPDSFVYTIGIYVSCQRYIVDETKL